MRVNVSHRKPKEEVIRQVDHSFDQLFSGMGVPVQITNEQRSWKGSVLTFSFTAKAGLLRAPIRGTVEVTDTEVIIDADLGFLERLLSAKQAKTHLEGRVRGLLT